MVEVYLALSLQVATLGVTWEVNAGHGQFFDQFIKHLEVWIATGGDPNPKQKRGSPGAVMADGYRITQQAQQARRALQGKVKNTQATDTQRSILRSMGFKDQINGTITLAELSSAMSYLNFNGSNTRKALEHVPVEQTLPNSREKVDCICPECNHAWITVIRYLTNSKIPCPNCREKSKVLRPSLSPLSKHENWVFIEPFWNWNKNVGNEINAESISEASERRACLTCPDCGFEFERQVSVLRRSFGCPSCAKAGTRFRAHVVRALSELSKNGLSDEQIGKRFAASPAVIRKAINGFDTR